MQVDVYIVNNQNQSLNATFYTEGTSHYSFVITTIGSLSGTNGTSGTNGASGTNGTSGTSGTGFNTISSPANFRILSASGSSTNSALANTGLTYDGFTFSVSGQLIINTSQSTGLTTGTTSIVSFTASAGNGAYFDYHLSGASNERRTGTVMATWDGTNVAFTETSTPDLNGSTTGIEFDVAIIGGNVTLRSVVTSGTWSVDTKIKINNL
jgi:hypothetical protein